MLPPAFDQDLRLGAAAEPLSVEQLVPQLAVKALDESVLPRAARRDEARADVFGYLERFHNPRMRRRVARRDREFQALIKPSWKRGRTLGANQPKCLWSVRFRRGNGPDRC